MINGINDLNNLGGNNNGDIGQRASGFFNMIIQKTKEWFNGITCIVKGIVAASVVLYLLNLITFGVISTFLSNITVYSISGFQIWRFITGNLMTTGLLSLLFALIFWVSDAVKIERMKGSAHYFIYFLIHSTIIQILYALLTAMFTSSKEKEEKIYYMSDGIWGFLMFEVTVLCLGYPEENIIILCIPYPIKAKFYPIILFVLFFILSGLQLDVFIGIGYGFLFKFFLEKFIVIPSSLIEKIEEKLFVNFRDKPFFVKNSEATGSQNPFQGMNKNNQALYGENQGNESAEAGNDGGFRAFAGEGIAVGGN